ncbi:hypothetical protein G6694_09735, partial [Polynucleobacter paneuropaeus]|nr:hypothetical protein [Polynucleobacter paneuropaeus]
TGMATGTNAGTYGSSLAVANTSGYTVLSNYNTPSITNANLVVSPKAVTITNAVSSTTYDGVTSYATLAANAGFTTSTMVGSDSV